VWDVWPPFTSQETLKYTLYFPRCAIPPNKMEEDTDSSCSECAICAETFSSIARAKVQCPYCKKICCAACAKRYLLETSMDPHCLYCKHVWDAEVIDGLPGFTRTFRKTELRRSRIKTLWERERSLLPQRQTLLVRDTLRRRANTAHSRYHAVLRQLSNINDRSIDVTPQLCAMLQKFRQEYREATDELLAAGGRQPPGAGGSGSSGPGTDGANAAVTMTTLKCSVDGCRGFLSSAWRCGLCETYTCKDCFEVKGSSRDAPHTCKEENLATANELKRSTKGCPKCGIRIFRTEGCSQMFCTACNTPFDWNTGRVIEGRVHNPHAFEFYQRAAASGDAAAAALQGARGGALPCDGALERWDHWAGIVLVNRLRTKFQSVSLNDPFRTITDLYRLCVEQSVAVPIAAYDQTTYEAYGVRFLRSELTEEGWRRALSAAETRRERLRRMRAVTQMVLVVAADLFRLVQDAETPEHVHAAVRQMRALREYTNEQYMRAAEHFDATLVPQISEGFVLRREPREPRMAGAAPLDG